MHMCCAGHVFIPLSLAFRIRGRQRAMARAAWGGGVQLRDIF